MGHAWFRAAVVAALGTALGASAPGASVRPTWPEGPNEAVLAGDLGTEHAEALSLAAGADGSLFLAWFDPSWSRLRAQKLSPDGVALWGTAGAIVREAGGLAVAGDGRITHEGPIDLFPASDGGLLVAWSEPAAPGRGLRAQRLDAAGTPLLSAGGDVLFPDMPAGPSWAAVIPDGEDGLLVAASVGDPASGTLLFQRMRAGGTFVHPSPGLLLDDASSEKRYPVLEALADGAAAVLWRRGGDLRMQVVDGGIPLHPPGGVPLAEGVAPGFPLVRATGTARKPLLLASYLVAAGDEARLLLARPDGSLLFDEASFPAGDPATEGIAGPPDIGTVGGLRRGKPVGIELHGIRAGDPRGALRAVRLPGGAWEAPEVIVPPVAMSAGQTGSIPGRLWTWDLGNRMADGQRLRLVGYRLTTVGRDLVPRLGPWLALAPGQDDGSRIVLRGRWLHLAWVDPFTHDLLATRVAVPSTARREAKRAPRFDRIRVVRTGASYALEGSAPRARLPGGVPGSDLRLHVGDDGGVKAILTTLSAVGGTGGRWTADLAASSGNVRATVEAGPGGRGVRVRVDGLPMDDGDRALFLRLEREGAAFGSGVLLRRVSDSEFLFLEEVE